MPSAADVHGAPVSLPTPGYGPHVTWPGKSLNRSSVRPTPVGKRVGCGYW